MLTYNLLCHYAKYSCTRLLFQTSIEYTTLRVRVFSEYRRVRERVLKKWYSSTSTPAIIMTNHQSDFYSFDLSKKNRLDKLFQNYEYDESDQAHD